MARGSLPVVGRLGLGLAALGRPGYLNLGHGGGGAGVRPLRRRAASPLARGARLRLRGSGSGTSTPPAPTAAAKNSWGSGCGSRNPVGRHGQLQVGLRLHRGLGGRRGTRQRSSTTTSRRSGASWRRRARTWGSGWRSTRSTPPRPRAACCPNDAVLSAMVEAGVPLGVSVERHQPGRDDRGRAVALGIFSAVQATWNLHERAAGDALSPVSDATEGHRQGGARQRAPRGPRRGGARRRPGPALGRRSSSAARRRSRTLRSNLRARDLAPPGELARVRRGQRRLLGAPLLARLELNPLAQRAFAPADRHRPGGAFLAQLHAPRRRELDQRLPSRRSRAPHAGRASRTAGS